MPRKILNLPKKKCLNCDKELNIKINRDVYRKNFCCRSCSTSYGLDKGIIGMIGKNHSEESKQKMKISGIGIHKNEKNGRYIDGRSTFRKRVFDNYEHICTVCGEKHKLIAHHKDRCLRSKERSRRILLGNHSIKNGEIVCSSCHKINHNGEIKDASPLHSLY